MSKQLNKRLGIILGHSRNSPDFNLGSLSASVQPYVRNLGVTFDSSLKFDKQISTVVKGSFFHLRSIAKLKQLLRHKDLETVIHAFITSRLDYCNSLYWGLPQSAISRLQIVQNAAARLLTGTRKTDHIYPILASLHWLPVKFRIYFKIAVYVYKAIAYSPQRALRSSNQFLLTVPRCRYYVTNKETLNLENQGWPGFFSCSPETKLWNSLPVNVRLAPSLASFKSALKSYLFSLAFE